MTNAEVFHHAATRYGYGPRLARERGAGTPAGELYAQVARQAETLIASARQLFPRLPHIHFDFVYNGAVNAFAFKENGQYFIGITSGTIVLLQMILNRILADSRLLPHAGDPASEASDLPPLTGLIADAQRMYEAGTLKLVRPKTKARWDYAGHLFFQASLFVIGHEIAHITLGHVDYLNSKTGTPVLPEIGWNLASPIGGIERQTLEVEADIRSFASRLESVRLRLNTPGQQIPLWSIAPPGFKDVLFDCAFSINVLFRLFGDVRFAGPDLSSASYPPLPFRRAMLMPFALYYAQSVWGSEWCPEYQNAAVVTLRYAVITAESAFATITGESLSLDGLQDAIGLEGFEHMKVLRDCWLRGLHDRLLSFAYESDSEPLGFLAVDPT